MSLLVSKSLMLVYLLGPSCLVISLVLGSKLCFEAGSHVVCHDQVGQGLDSIIEYEKILLFPSSSTFNSLFHLVEIYDVVGGSAKNL
jgi:hypothetical protein